METVKIKHISNEGRVLIDDLIGLLNTGDYEEADKVYKTILASGNKDLIDTADKIFERV